MARAEHPDPLVEAVARFADGAEAMPPGATVVVGVSGGADSVALLAALRELAGQRGRNWRLVVAHLNHRLRPDADADEEFVRQLAAGWGLAFVSEQADVKALAGRRGLGIEESAREARYEFLLRVAREAGGAGGTSGGVVRVAVAHHADDNAETVLYRIARGTHLRGLAGIPPCRPLAGQDEVLAATGEATDPILLVRPLLGVRRGQIEDFLRRRGLTWRTDSTNADARYRRNLIRHQVLPLLRQINPQADEAILRLAHAAAEVEGCLAALAAGLVSKWDQDERGVALPLGPLVQALVPVRRAALRMHLERLGVPMGDLTGETLAALGELPDRPGGAVNLPGGFIARTSKGRLLIECPPGLPRRGGPVAGGGPGVELACPGRTVLSDGRALVCRLEPFSAKGLAEHKQAHRLGVELLDADRVRLPLVCRPRRRGDQFHPLGSRGRKSVSNFLTDLKLPPAQREAALCIRDAAGIVYLAPLRIDHRVRLGEHSRRVLRIELVPA